MQPTIMPDDVAKIMEDQNTKWQAVTALGLASSARRSELSNIKIENIDLAHRTISVTGKNREQRNLPISWSLPYLQAYLTELKGQGITKGSLFNLTDEGIKSHFQRLSKKIGKPLSTHSMRRGYAVIGRKMKISDTALMQNAAWKNPTMLMRYSKALDITQANEIYNQFSEDTANTLGLLPTLKT